MNYHALQRHKAILVGKLAELIDGQLSWARPTVEVLAVRQTPRGAFQAQVQIVGEPQKVGWVDTTRLGSLAIKPKSPTAFDELFK